jgi:ethanolamine ammonia-lyase large subunit
MMNREQMITAFALANEFKEGDLAVGGTRDDAVRQDARRTVGALRISDISRNHFVADKLSEVLDRSLDKALQGEIASLTIDQVKQTLLGSGGAAWAERFRPGLSSEVIAAVAKIMTGDELGRVSRSIFNPLPGAGVAIGSPGHFGSRIQPNSPGDDSDEILISILEGLAFGCGDVIIGLNPAGDNIDTIVRLEELLANVVERLELPTRFCVLSDIVKQTAARAQTRVDVGFQSLAGTSKALAGMVGLDVDGLLDLARGFSGLYFETGQGSAVTNGAAEGIDMVTLEARAYGLARYIKRETGTWTIVNDVAGFIGPEVFRSADQLLRACLEDTAMAKLHGLTMGLDVCATFHMGIDPDSLRRLTASIVSQSAPAYLMAVAGNADPMLGYLTTSFRQHPALKHSCGKQMTSAMAARLGSISGPSKMDGLGTADLYARYMKVGADSRSLDNLVRDGEKKLRELRERGFDLGYGAGSDDAMPTEAAQRLDAIYRNARAALYSAIDSAVLRDCSTQALHVETEARGREDYLSHPAAGERLSARSAALLGSLYPVSRPKVQIVISDGLNANAINQNLRQVLAPLRRTLTGAEIETGEADIVIRNGRVRAGYHVGQILQPDIIVHLLGERPGTGIDALSAYLTYGKDVAGRSRWSTDMDHSATTAVCGIHRRGKHPEVAVDEIAACVRAMLRDHCSGVALTKAL